MISESQLNITLSSHPVYNCMAHNFMSTEASCSCADLTTMPKSCKYITHERFHRPLQLHSHAPHICHPNQFIKSKHVHSELADVRLRTNTHRHRLFEFDLQSCVRAHINAKTIAPVLARQYYINSELACARACARTHKHLCICTGARTHKHQVSAHRDIVYKPIQWLCSCQKLVLIIKLLFTLKTIAPACTLTRTHTRAHEYIHIEHQQAPRRHWSKRGVIYTFLAHLYYASADMHERRRRRRSVSQTDGAKPQHTFGVPRKSSGLATCAPVQQEPANGSGTGGRGRHRLAFLINADGSLIGNHA